jgi:Mrp family chromosome partitioning ATPase
MELDSPTKVSQIASPSAGDGTTTTSANIAWIMAEAGQRVVFVSCDLRRPRIHEFFGLPNDIGFTSVLLGEAELEDGLLRVTNESRLQVLQYRRGVQAPQRLRRHRRRGQRTDSAGD